MTSLAAQVLRSVKTRALAAAGERVVVAVSGGADSVALLHLLLEIGPSLDVFVVGIAHLNHGLRGADADRDQAFVEALARSLQLPLYVSSRDVAELAREQGLSIERAGHEARRAFYAWAIASSGASVLATGHTADDQAETVLLRLIRGAGTKGLGGIHPRNGRIVRPLLDVSRAELRRFLEARRLRWREDASNDDPAIARNRVRAELVPLLRDRFSPAVVRTLARVADVLRSEDAYLEAAATAAASAVVLPGEQGVALDRAGIRALHPAVARRVVRQALHVLGPDRSVGARPVDLVLDLARGPRRDGRVRLSGAIALVSDQRIDLRPYQGAGRDRPLGSATLEGLVALAVPGETEVPGLGLRFLATWSSGTPAGAAAGVGTTQDVVVLHPSVAAGGLFVRTRRPGDRLRPEGLAGSRKLQDLFVDRKVPRAERDRVPVVVNADGGVVWVVGHAAAHAAVARGDVSSVLLLKVQRPGGLG